MARVDITEIQPGDSLTASSMNTTIENWRDATDSDGHAGKINEKNIRDGGIDQRQFLANVVNGAVNTGDFFYNVEFNHIPPGPDIINPATWLAAHIGDFYHVKDGIGERKYLIRLNFSYVIQGGELAKITTYTFNWTLYYQIGYEVNNSGTVHPIAITTRNIQISKYHFEYDNAKGSSGLTYVFQPNSHSIVDGDKLTFYIMTSQHTSDATFPPKFIIDQVTFHAQRYDR